MKKAILLILLVIGTLGAFSQTPVAAKKEDPIVKDTVIQGNHIQIHQGSKGGYYVMVTSKTTGTVYRKYLKKGGF